MKTIRALFLMWPLFATIAMAATNTVQVMSNFFTPDPTTITLGDTVHWVWAAPFHSTTAAAGQLESWDSGVQNSGSFDHTFNNLGTFGYICTVHGFNAGCGNGGAMSGKVIVVLPGAIAAQITGTSQEGSNVRVTWITGGLCKTNVLQRATGDAAGSFTNDFADLFTITNTLGNVTNFLDVGAATNFPARYYRVRVP